MAVQSPHPLLLQVAQFGHQVLDLCVLLTQHGLQPLQLDGVGPGALELHQGGQVNLHQDTGPGSVSLRRAL